MTFDPTKPVQTRDGRKARIICADAKGLFPIVALVEVIGSKEDVCTYNDSGRIDLWVERPLDLINIPVKHTLWLNIYRDGSSAESPTREKADSRAIGGDRRIARIKVEYTEGQFDE